MEAVGQLVRLGADEGGLGLVHGAVELLRRHVGQLPGEELLHLGEDGLDKGQGAADQVFVEPGLALVDAHGHAPGQAGVLQLVGDAQLVLGVAPLVDDGVHGEVHIVLVVMGGDAHVLVVELQGVGVLRLTDGAVGPVQPQHLHQVVGEPPLPLHGITPAQEGVVGRLLLHHGVEQGDDALSQGGEEAVQVGHIHPPLILVEQGVVGGLGAVVIPGKLDVEGHQLFQHRAEQLEIAGLLGPVPHVAGLVGEDGVLHILVRRDARELAVRPAQLLHLPADGVVQPVPALPQKVQQLPHLRGGEQLMPLPGQHAQGHPPALGGVLGGHGGAVQVQRGGRRLIGVHLPLQLGQPVQRLLQFHGTLLISFVIVD